MTARVAAKCCVFQMMLLVAECSCFSLQIKMCLIRKIFFPHVTSLKSVCKYDTTCLNIKIQAAYKLLTNLFFFSIKRQPHLSFSSWHSLTAFTETLNKGFVMIDKLIQWSDSVGTSCCDEYEFPALLFASL